MTRNQVRGLTAEIIEKSIAKHSNGQLTYVGDDAVGYDFVDTAGIKYECKSKQNLFQKKSYFTKEIIIKNYFGVMTASIPKTFDYMLLIDTVSNVAGIVSFDDCVKCAIIRNSSITTKIPLTDIKYVAQQITPTKKPNFEDVLNNFIAENL